MKRSSFLKRIAEVIELNRLLHGLQTNWTSDHDAFETDDLIFFVNIKSPVKIDDANIALPDATVLVR